MNASIAEFITRHKPCHEAQVWLQMCDFPSVQAAWDACERSDWMLWTLRRIGAVDPVTWARLACAFVRETPVEDGRENTKVWNLLNDERSRRGIEAVEQWCGGRATREEVREAQRAAYAAFAAYGFSGDRYAVQARAASAASYATETPDLFAAVEGAAFLADCAADAAASASASAYLAAYGAAHASYAVAHYAAAAHKAQCAIIRRFVPVVRFP